MTVGRQTFAERAGAASDDRTAQVVAAHETAAAGSMHSVRVSFADQHGVLHAKTIPIDRLDAVVRDGIGMPGSMLAKDTGGRYAFGLWEPSGIATLDALVGAQDMVLLPDPSTFRTLPWVEGTGWILCDLYTTDARRLPLSTRALCARAADRLSDIGFRLVAGLEIEFQLRDDSGEPVHPGWDLLAEGHADMVHDRLEPLRSGLTALGLAPRSVEVELGPGQIEMTFPPTDAISLADDAVLVRSALAQMARRNGMRAEFMCRPGTGAFPSGWHLHQSVVDDHGVNAFVPPPADATGADGSALLSDTGRYWVGGLLAHAPEACMLTTPTVNGYKRYRPDSVAPDRIAWSHQNRGAMLRVVGGPGDDATRVENRVGDPSANPYLYVASQLVAGADGLRRHIEPPPPTVEPYSVDAGPQLPRSLGEAVEAFENGRMFVEEWGEEVVAYLARLKGSEWARFLVSVTDWEQREYGDLF